MSCHIYKTEGIILKKRDSGEADKLFSFFTEEFGRVEVVAQSIRNLKSKLRYRLNGFSILKLGFVATSGDFWRLVDVGEEVIFEEISNNIDKMRAALGIILLCERLIKGQETDKPLWNELKQALFFLEKNNLSEKEAKNLKLFTGLKIFRHLGYLDYEEVGNLSFKEIDLRKKHYLSLAKRALEVSQL